MKTTMTREEALQRWHRALQQKKEATARMVAELVEDYEREYGEKPKHIEVW